MSEETSKTSEELFRSPSWEAVRELRRRNNREVFRLAQAYCRSEIAEQRARALDVLAQLGAGKPQGERPHFADCVSLALAHLDDEDVRVVRSAAWALAHLKDDRSLTALIGMAHSTDPDVRVAVATGLLGSDRPDAIRTVIELMEDSADEVRNWATFALGVAYIDDGSRPLGTLDSSEIREALRKRLADSFSEVRDEALWGLALRKDPSALSLLLDRLNASEWIEGDETTAADVLGLTGATPVEDLRKGLQDLLQL